MTAPFPDPKGIPLVPVEEIDEWRAQAEVKAFALQQRDVENRARCPRCDEVGSWLVQNCDDGAGHPVPDGVYCGVHCPPSVHAGDGVLSMNSYGWVQKGDGWFTWPEGFPKW
jgi:hypothetical protein